MHLEFLVEDQSGKKFLDLILPRVVAKGDTFKVHAYKGIGRIPHNFQTRGDASKRILLEQLPKLLNGYGNAFANYPADYQAVVVVVCDLDDKDPVGFLAELEAVLEACHSKPMTRFCVAVEEGEAWLLGDIPAIKKAYPGAKDAVLNAYVNDSICGTWEVLAEAVFPAGVQTLSKSGFHAVGAEKFSWAERITPHMEVERNSSPSFKAFIEVISQLTTAV
jgi:hypothetical protein